jgi:polysaccharide biosynthesis protein PslH
LLSGSGIRLKILEAMSAGKIVIATTIGAQGINYTKNKNLLIADNLDEFIKAFSLLQQDLTQATALQEEGRKLIVEEYSNQKVIKDLISNFKRFLSNK